MPITRRTYPGFRLTNSTQVTILRKGKGQYVNGDWVPASDTSISIEANVQPMQFKEILQMPESERTKEWIKVFSVEILRTGNESVGGWEADIVLWQGESYRVMRCKNYVMGVLDHYCAYAAKEPSSAR